MRCSINSKKECGVFAGCKYHPGAGRLAYLSYLSSIRDSQVVSQPEVARNDCTLEQRHKDMSARCFDESAWTSFRGSHRHRSQPLSCQQRSSIFRSPAFCGQLQLRPKLTAPYMAKSVPGLSKPAQTLEPGPRVQSTRVDFQTQKSPASSRLARSKKPYSPRCCVVDALKQHDGACSLVLSRQTPGCVSEGQRGFRPLAMGEVRQLPRFFR